jgi:hypothetical protein
LFQKMHASRGNPNISKGAEAPKDLNPLLQRIALILICMADRSQLIQDQCENTVDAVLPSTGPITVKSAVGDASRERFLFGDTWTG